MSARSLFIIRDEDNATARYRATWPSRHLRKHGRTADVASYAEVRGLAADLDNGKYDVIVTNSLTTDDSDMAEQIVAAIDDLGVGFVYDMDDDLVSDYAVERMERLRPDQHPWRALHDNRLTLLRAADLVTVSRAPLAEMVRPHTAAPIRVVENAIDVDVFGNELALGRRRATVPPVVGWAGATREPEDLEIVAEGWHKLAAKCPDVRFAIQGIAEDNPLARAVPPDRLYGYGWAALTAYAGRLRNLDVACCAIADTPFGRCKSAIKWFEMSLAGRPCVVSETVYGEYVTNGADALVARDASDWCEMLEFLVRDPERGRRVARRAAGAVAERHSMAARWAEWGAAWDAAVAKVS